MKNYLITFNYKGSQHSKSVEADNCGCAYAKVVKEYPGAEIVRGLIQRQCMGSIMWMEYEPVSTKKPDPLPKNVFLQEEMALDDPRRPK